MSVRDTLGDKSNTLRVERIKDPHTGEDLYKVEPADFDDSPDLIGAIMVALGAAAQSAIRGRWSADQFARVALYAYEREGGNLPERR